MPLNGSGVFTPKAPEFPAIPNTVILASDFNAIWQDASNALSLAFYRDGQAPALADINFANHKILNLADGASGQDAVNFTQVFRNPNFVGTTVAGVKITGTTFDANTNFIHLQATTNVDVICDGFNVESNNFHFTGGALLTIDSANTVIEGNYYEITTVTSVLQSSTISMTGSTSFEFNAPSITITGTNIDMTGSTLATLRDGSTAVTQPGVDNSNKIATTAFVAAAALGATFPVGVGNDKKFIGQLGGVAGWVDSVYDDQFFISDSTDTTKKIRFELNGITTGTTRVVTFPNTNLTVVGTTNAQTITNKTLTIDDDKLTILDEARPTTNVKFNLDQLPLGVSRQIIVDDTGGDIVLGAGEWKLINSATLGVNATNYEFLPAIFDGTYSMYKLEIEDSAVTSSSASLAIQARDTANNLLTSSIYRSGNDAYNSRTGLLLGTMEDVLSASSVTFTSLIFKQLNSTSKWKICYAQVLDGSAATSYVRAFTGQIRTVNAIKSFLFYGFTGGTLAAGIKFRWYGKAG